MKHVAGVMTLEQAEIDAINASAHNHDGAYAASSHNHAASDINSGTIGTARLGSGTADSTKYLRGDQTWAAPPGGGWEFPIGYVLISTVNTNPATFLGYGTWAAAGQGKFVVFLDPGDADFDTAGETGGAKAVTLTAAQSGLPQHTHVQDAHNHTQDAHTHVQDAHAHVENSNNATTGGLRGWGAPDTSTSTPTATGYSTDNATAVNQDATATNQPATATNQNAGPSAAAEAHTNLPPYIVWYAWERTA